MLLGALETGDICALMTGSIVFSLGLVFSIFTVRSYQAAWPVIGSEFDHLKPSPLGGNSS